MSFFPKLSFVVLAPLAAVLLFGVSQASAHENDRRERFHERVDNAHREGHRDLRGLHSEFHEYPSTRREHKRFHHQLKNEHRDQHRALSEWQKDYRRSRYRDGWRNDDRWGWRNRDGWRRGYGEYNSDGRGWYYGMN